MSATPFEQLAETAADQLDPMRHQRPLLDAARAAMNEVGIGAARRSLADALAAYTAAQTNLRTAQAAESLAKSIHDDALRDAEWEADDPARFVVEGNKTYLVLDVPNDSGEMPRRQVTAEQRREWVRTQAVKSSTVIDAAHALAIATEDTAMARDAITFAERRLQAARHDLDAAAVQLAALTAALSTRNPIR